VTLAACVVSLLVAVFVAWRADERWPFLLVPLWMFLSMAFNAIDGMLAREFGQKSPLGAYLNELTDVVSDSTLYLPFALSYPFRCGRLRGGSARRDLRIAGVLGLMVGASRPTTADGQERPRVRVRRTRSLDRHWAFAARVGGLHHAGRCRGARAHHRQPRAARGSPKELDERRGRSHRARAHRHERTFRTHRRRRSLYRHWPAPEGPARGAIVLFHRGHEHAGRMAQLVDELGLPEFDFFAWDARGHGRSPGARGDAPSISAMIRDVQTFAEHICDVHGFAMEDIAVVAQSVGAVLVAAWVHDYAPRIRCMVLASPAFKVKLYVPLRASRPRPHAQDSRQLLRDELRQGEVSNPRPRPAWRATTATR
jgi:hypothetical protein